jgi:hypothetical protein
MNLFKKKTGSQTTMLLSTRGSFFHQMGRDYYVDWGVMLALVFVVTLICIGLGAYAYVNIEGRLSEASTLDTAKKPETVDEQKLQAIVEQYSARAAERAILLKGYGGFGDPSL